MGMSRVKASTIPIVILVTLSLMTTSVNAFSAVVVSTARQRPCSTFGSTTGSTASIMADRYSSQHFTTTTRYSATKQDTDKDYHRKRRPEAVRPLLAGQDRKAAHEGGPSGYT